MQTGNDTIDFMRGTLEVVGYDIGQDENGWGWSNGEMESGQAFPTLEGAVREAWDTASDFVRTVLGGTDAHDGWPARWSGMSVAQQAKLIMMCFEEGDDDRAIVADGLFQAIRENDMLKKTIGTIGLALESGDANTASTTWMSAKREHGISVQH